ncbi:hypothetical protein [Nocardioides massiliensis]|uniref:Uncharacterized protein n=1 Tax=Nocardioides massiliensis TaxID=1325935 RepID=A0ABT9NUJ5_9ACTN|nr:hypothetical protein [Nocardioides massiliensis]MDP9824097.1 hypothetical protein [Nocardioides massiliensis]
MEILLWLVPPVVVTVLTAGWVSWAERRAVSTDTRSEADYARFAAAVQRPLDRGRRPRATRAPARPVDRSTGVAVRPSRRDALPPTRRSA